MVATAFSPQWQQILSQHAELNESAKAVLAGSDFVLQWGQRYPERAEALLQSGDLQQGYAQDSLSVRLQQYLDGCHDENTLQRQLRLFRQREMVRIIWRDLADWADLAETVTDLSAMADACIRQALQLLYQWQCDDLGTPQDADGQPQTMLVLGMGKLGARELNLSSDIDLIFSYPQEGETRGGRRTLTNGEFFIRLGRKLVQALDNVTVDGFVFRVDMRLRPFGDSGALAISFDAMEEYYQTQGREWERYALIKARAITGTEADKTDLMARLRPFVYRRYLDYGVFDALREMKSMIAAQLYRKGMDANIKLGAGGIREIEFIGQVFQLIYGGRDKALQQRPILVILDLLAERELLTSAAVTALKAAYVFLRRTEHRIQAWKDQQTHLLPDDEAGQIRLAQLMGFEDWPSFSEMLAAHRKRVQDCFEQILTSPQREASQQETVSLLNASDEEKSQYLQHLGYTDAQACVQKLNDLLTSARYRHSGEISQERFKRLLPLVVKAVAQVQEPDTCLARLLPLMETILQRSAYISLLIENPLALSQLVKLCAASVWISHQLTRHPVLLDELLDPRSLYEVPDRDGQKTMLAQWISSADPHDLERQMNQLREFKQMTALHIAAADITGILPVMAVGNQLTQLAEVLLAQVMKIAWQYLVSRHGYPPQVYQDHPEHSGLLVVGYGKLGGMELGYGSDLDLVFFYDDTRIQGYTSGEKSVDVAVFYTRLAQRIIHILNTVTSSGILYEVDMRLRPNGQSGLLVTPVSGFEAYQQQDAWTWEHQALVRARSVVGDSQLAQQFTAIRQRILAQQRDPQVLVSEVRDMRAKMRDNLDKSNAQQFDLKQGTGGITDIEFLVQYAVLAWAGLLPELLVYTDNIRLLETLAQTGKLSAAEARLLIDAYRDYRQLANYCVLQEKPAVVPVERVADYRQQITKLWQTWFA